MKSCFHCSETCDEEIEFDAQIFCCVGCKTVYEILSGSDMKTYYSLDKNAGIKPNGESTGLYNYLELQEFADKLIFFEDGSIKKARFFLPQIHCSSCLWLLERLHQLKDGIIQSQVDFVKKEVVITFDTDKISLRNLAELCATIGYPPKITLKDYDGKSNQSSNRILIIQIGVSGFCFGNIMLLSFPEYLGLGDGDANFRQLFSILNVLLSIPVLLYGGKDYLISAYKTLRAKKINIDVPISLGIVALYSQSCYEIFTSSGAGYMDSFAGLIFFLLIGKWFQNQTYTAINFERDYESYFPISVTRKLGDQEEIIALKNILIGDRLIIRNNELIPTDAILMRGRANIDYSFVTGESALLEKHEGDKLYAGGRQEGSIIEVEVLKAVENSYLTQLWNNPIFDKEKETQSLSDTISTYFTYFIILLALVSGTAWYFMDPSKSIFVITSILIVACPCAIALSVPFTYGNSVRILGRLGFYLRSTKVIEPLSGINAVVLDKTGTITESANATITWEGSELSAEDEEAISTLVSTSAHPLSRKIATRFSFKNSSILSNVKEIIGEGLIGEYQGIEWKIGNFNFVGGSKTDNRTRVFVAKNNHVLGSFLFSNSYREGLKNLLNNLAETKSIHILSGDNDAELEALKKLAPASTRFNFNQVPLDKLNYIAELQKKGEKVMMLGDGLNDAGALKQSDLGISVVDDIYAFSPASDAIIAGNKLVLLNDYINFSSFSKRVVKWSYLFSITYNSIGLVFAVSGSLTPLVAAILMPLSSISVVLFVTLMTNLKARKLN